MKIFKSSSIISFDFDDTLTQPIWDEEDGLWVNYGDPRPEIIEKVRELASEGHQIVIVTSRPMTHIKWVKDFITKYNLPISKVHFTNGELKGPRLQELGVTRHYDDCPEELKSAEEYGIETNRVWHPYDLEQENSIASTD